MRNFTYSNYLSKATGYDRFLMKGLLLCMALVLFQFTQVLAQDATEQATEAVQVPDLSSGDGVPDINSDTGLPLSAKEKAQWATAKNGDYYVAENEPLSTDINCANLRVVLVLDESGSIVNKNGVDQVRDATAAFANVFQGSPAQLTIIEFGSFARTIELGSTVVTPDFITNLNGYLYDDYDDQSYDPILGDANADCPLNYTNWQDALQEIDELPGLPPNLVIFLTDGVPSAYNTDENDCGYIVSANSSSAMTIGLELAIEQANQLKEEDGVHMFSYGVGDNIDQDNLQLISGPNEFGSNGDIFTDDWSQGSFEDLADNLSAGLNSICGTELELTKTVNFEEVCGENQDVTFTLTVENTGGSTNFDAVDVIITDVFPDAFDIDEESLPDGAVLDGQTLTYNAGNIPANESVSIQIQASLLNADEGLYVNTASANAVNALEVEADASVEKAEDFNSTVNIEACQSFTLVPGDYVSNPEDDSEQELTSDGSPHVVVIDGETESGCPKTVTLNVTVNEPNQNDPDIEISCGPFTWEQNGETYESSGTYIIVDSDEGLCEQYELQLTVVPSTLIEGDVVSCENEYQVVIEVQEGDEVFEFTLTTISQSGPFYQTFDLGELCYIIDLDVTLNAEVGDSCDDGNPQTGDGTIALDDDGNCFCEEGEIDPCAELGGDSDGDEICDDNDPCPLLANLENGDDCTTGNDEEGTVVDCECVVLDPCAELGGDSDGDEICDDNDPCPLLANLENGDDCTTENEEDGTVVDCNCVVLDPCADLGGDTDGDGICDDQDNCPNEPNPDQQDTDQDGVGDVCDLCDGNDASGDTDGDGVCDNADPCPQLADLENEDACVTDFGQEGTVENCECVPDNNPGVIDCDDWVVYLADIVSGGVTDIYEVDFSGGDASLTLIATSQIQVHIAYNAQNNLIYAVSNADGSYRTLNPHDENPEFSETTFIDADIDRVTQAAINADGKLVIGNAGSDIIYSINLSTNAVSVYDNYAPIEGGDIAFGEDGKPFMATKEGNGKLYVLMPPQQMQIGDLPGNVTGLALSSTNQLLVSNAGSTSFLVRELSGADNGDTIDIFLNDFPFQTSAGDMASGCSTFSDPNEGDCNNFNTFYANHGSGISGTDLYGVTYFGSDAILEFIANVGFQAHIAYNAEDNVLYLVNANGSEVVILDPDGANPPFAIAIQGSINQVYAVVYNPSDELLYVGDANDDEIYTLDPLTGDLVLFSEGSSVDGGDLALQNDKLYLADRSGRDLYEVIAGANNDVLVGDIPSNVNGMAQANNATGLIVSRANTDEFVEVDAADGTTIQTYTAILNGESFTLLNGDMAAGCSEDENVEIPCEGPWRTQTQGGWGSPGSGDNPGVYRDANFDAAFPGGLSIGCNDGFSLTLTSASAVQSFLPSSGSPSVFDEDLTDPGDQGSFAGNLTALALSLGFDAYDEDFGASEYALADLYIQEGDFEGLTIGELFALANDVIGGCNENYTPSQVNDAIDAINNAYVDGDDQQSSFIGCSEPGFEEDICEDSGECYGVTVNYVQGTIQGGGAIAANRANPANALGEPEGTDNLVFTTLGYGGSLTFEFDGVVPNGPGDDIEVVETSFNNPGCDAFPEYADVSVSVDGSTYYSLGTVCKSNPFVDISDADVEIPLECVSYVRVSNNDDWTTTSDGFDVDGIVALHNCDDNGDEDEGPALTGVEANNALTSFPNPTSGLSQAVFVTAETERATLEVYDMNGRVVETLFNQVANANQEYRVDFDGMDLPNGVYVYRLTTDSEVTVEKFMIAR